MSVKSQSLKDDTATQLFGAGLAPHLRKGDVIALWGDLGAGKTTLARGLIRGLAGTDIDVPSPTFTLVQMYEFAALDLWHFDLYRLETPNDVFELGWDETMNGVALIEWPDRAGAHLPDWRLDIKLETVGDGRSVRLEPQGEDWQTRLNGF